MTATLQTTFNDAPATAFIGQLDTSRHANKSTARNSDIVAMPFGTPIVWDPAGALSDLDATIPANSTDKLRGIVYRTDSYMPGFTDSSGTHGEFLNGVLPGVNMDVARAGRIFVKTMQAVAPGDPAFISYAAGGGTYTAAGQYGKTAAGGSALDCTGRCMWDSTAAAGAGAWLLFDFTKSA